MGSTGVPRALADGDDEASAVDSPVGPRARRAGKRRTTRMRWRTNPEVIVQRLGDSMVLVNLATDRILELNDTAATLFELAGSGLSDEEMTDRLVEEFGVEPQAARQELNAALELLAGERVVERRLLEDDDL
jgi:hypothetical protein